MSGHPNKLENRKTFDRHWNQILALPVNGSVPTHRLIFTTIAIENIEKCFHLTIPLLQSDRHRKNTVVDEICAPVVNFYYPLRHCAIIVAQWVVIKVITQSFPFIDCMIQVVKSHLNDQLSSVHVVLFSSFRKFVLFSPRNCDLSLWSFVPVIAIVS